MTRASSDFRNLLFVIYESECRTVKWQRSVAYDRNNAKPLYYEDYPGSIVDVSQLQYTLEKQAVSMSICMSKVKIYVNMPQKQWHTKIKYVHLQKSDYMCKIKLFVRADRKIMKEDF